MGVHTDYSCRWLARTRKPFISIVPWKVTSWTAFVNQYSGIYNNPFLSWGRYRKGWLRTTLPISFQFHHAQMDGCQAASFLQYLQNEIYNKLQ